MVPSNNQTKKRSFQKLFWLLEHLLLPGLIVFLGIAVNNYYHIKKQPHIVVHREDHKIMKLSENKFMIKCPFIISNEGGSTSNNKKVSLFLPQSVVIDEIQIPEQHKSFYDIKEGGQGYNYVIISINLPKEIIIEGAVTFYSNIEIPEKSMSPLNIIY